MNTKRLQVGVLFGGQSVEHEISIITALQLMKAMDVEQYEPVPIYINPEGHWFCGKALFNKTTYLNFSGQKHLLSEVTLLPTPATHGLKILRHAKRPFHEILKCNPRADTIPIDVYILAFHGEYGEDGAVQGLLELNHAPYSGCSVLASSLSMDKPLCKQVLKSHGIPVLPEHTVRKSDAQTAFTSTVDKIMADPALGDFPYFVKPRHLGSSIGIGIAHNKQELAQRLAKVFYHDSEAMIEPCLTHMFEINISVQNGRPPIASTIEVPHASEEVLSFDDKYLSGAKKTGAHASGMASLPRSINPDTVPTELKNAVTEHALNAYQILGASGIVRFDFMIDSEHNQLYFNELNPIPGSMAFYLWIESQPLALYTDNINGLIHDALQRKSEQLSLEKSIEFRALKVY